MKYNLPTRERCQEIVKNSDAFFCNESVVEGQKVEMYNYRLASIGDFQNGMIKLTEGDEEILVHYDTPVNNIKIGEMTDDEIGNLGFEFFRSI